ncbi:hypothetical protein D3C80_1224990 [compost metagenome]
MHQQVVQANKHRAQEQGHNQHPDQFASMFAEEMGIGGALCQIDDPAQVAEQCHFDQRANQAHYQQDGKAGPDLAKVV